MASRENSIEQHTCFKDDGGTPNRRCYACELEMKSKQPFPIDPIKEFGSGATRNSDETKPDYEGFIHPLVIEAFGEYMHENRFQMNGTFRASDNWQSGIPFDNYMKSLLRHVIELWIVHRTNKLPFNKDTNRPFTRKELLSAILFNAMGYLKELILPSELNQDRKMFYDKIDNMMNGAQANVERSQRSVGETKGYGAYRAKGNDREETRGLGQRGSESIEEDLSTRGGEGIKGNATVLELREPGPIFKR